MDHDQEVVREPFDDNGGNDSEYSFGQRSPFSHHAPNRDRSSSRLIEANSNVDHERHNRANKKDQSELMQLSVIEKAHEEKDEADDTNSVSSSSFIEDASFAQSFGIELKRKNKRMETAYDKLLKSNQYFEQPKSAQQEEQQSIIKTSVTSDCIYHRGTFYQKGDIVALCDQVDGQLYFAQLTGFLQDQYCEKSASINWLVPVRRTSRKFFDPAAYQLGVKDVQLRKLDCMTFIRHCPHDYYLRKFFNQPKLDTEEQKHSEQHEQDSIGNRLGIPLACSSSSKRFKDRAYIWTTMNPCKVPQVVRSR